MTTREILIAARAKVEKGWCQKADLQRFPFMGGAGRVKLETQQ